MIKNLRIGDLLVESGIITEEQLTSALSIQKGSGGKKLGDILIDLEIITEIQLIDTLKKKLNLQTIDLYTTNIESEVIKEVKESVARAKNIIPVKLNGRNLIIATADPLDYDAINMIGVESGRNVDTVLATKSEIKNAIDKHYSKSQVDSIATSLSQESVSLEKFSTQDFSDVEDRVGNVPLVMFINRIVEQAYVKRASDIHIEPLEEEIIIRYRVDGDLLEITRLALAVHAKIVTRVKIMGDMNIAEKRIPLDGRFSLNIGGSDVNIRVSTMPTVYGEKIVMRLLSDSKKGILTITELGMNAYNLDIFNKVIKTPNGIILVTGPTGSGKTTTLYSILNELATVEKNVVTIEDPVEKIVVGTNQTQVNQKAGLTFAAGLRAILRQDPDIIMVGEVRDAETADISTRAAITGHLVLASMHTNDAASAFMRLMDMGIEPFIVSSAVVAVVAQRLVKIVCPFCVEEYAPNEDEKIILKEMGIPEVEVLVRGRGCDRCDFTGHLGRTSIHEIVTVDNKLKAMIQGRSNTAEISEYLTKHREQRFLIDNAADLVVNKQSTLKDVFNISVSL